MTLARRPAPRWRLHGPAASTRWSACSSGGVRRSAFPGAVLAIGKDGALVRLRAFGQPHYARARPRSATDTIYDLASLTKVV